MQAEIISIGTELLLGAIVDTNAPYISQRLAEIGVDLYHRATVGDNEERIARCVEQALERADVVLCTGGLGPTVDDVTRQAMARATGRELELDEEMLGWIKERFRRWGHPMGENNRRQAFKPEGAIAIENPVGTAPIFIVQDGRGDVIVLPGVPHEMKYLMEREVIRYLKDKLGHEEVIKTRVLRTVGIGESRVDSQIGELMESANPTVGLAAHPGQTDVRIVAKATSEDEVDRLIAEMEKRVRERLEEVIYGVGEETVAEVVARMLAERELTLGTVECGVGGLVSSRVFEVPDGPTVLGNSLIVDDVGEAIGLLDLPRPQFGKAGDFSAKAARAAAREGRSFLGVDLCLAVWARGPIADDPRERLPIHIALHTGQDAVSQTFQYGGHSERAEGWLVSRALDMVRRALL
ncbi:MAG: CinA family nicotinamide mononucleotide deamidase-related protein [Chloroflexota bacterium]|nr:CinA family nicotinamide mononucleotide deamidase-related protein [Chloroflexota bacterium]